MLRFRNYQPTSDSLQGLAVEKPSVPSVEEQVDVGAVVHKDATQEPLLNLAPKRPNWDLKRDIAPQMKKLRTMTDRSSAREAMRVAACPAASPAHRTHTALPLCACWPIACTL